jgi:ferredoxin
MSYIIGSACISCIDGACLNVCPVDCIHGPISPTGEGYELFGMTLEDKEGKQLYIDPDVCINCGACVPECPVDAIYTSENEAIKMNDEDSVKTNYEFFGKKYKKSLI